MEDPIKLIYNKLSSNKIIDTFNYSEDSFRKWVETDNSATDVLFKKLADNKIISTDNYSLNDFSNWLKPREKLTTTTDPVNMDQFNEIDKGINEIKTSSTLIPLQTGFNTSPQVAKQFTDTYNKSKLTFQKQEEKKKLLLDQSIEDLDPDKVNEILHGNRDKNIVDNAKKQQGKAVFEILENIKDIHIPTLGSSTKASISMLENKLEADQINNKIIRDTEVTKLSEYSGMLSQRIENLSKKLGDTEQLKTFKQLNDKIISGGNLSPEESDFYNQQLEYYREDPNFNSFLQALDKKAEVNKELNGLDLEFKQVAAIDKLKKANQKELDEKISKSGWYNGLYTTGNFITSIPKSLAYNIGKTALDLTGNISALNNTSSTWDKDYWEKTSKASRPSSENIATVNYNGEEYEIAFDEYKRAYAIYKDGFDANVSDSYKAEIFEKLSKENPNFETKKKTNLYAIGSQGINTLTDVAGTMALTYLTAGLGGGLSGVRGLSNVGKALLSPRIATIVPIMSQYMGTFAEQAIKEGGITDANEVLKYSLAGASIEALTEMINPLESKAVLGFLNKTRKFDKNLLELITKEGTDGLLKRAMFNTKEAFKSLAGDAAKESFEEYVAEGLGFLQNEIYNKNFDADFDNENPVTIDNIRDIGLITAISTILPGSINLLQNSNKSKLLKEGLFSALHSPDVVEDIVNNNKQNANENTAKNLDNFLKTFNNIKSKVSDFTTGDLKNSPKDFKEEVFSTAYELNKIADNKDKASEVLKESLNDHLEDLKLKAKYDIFEETDSIPKDKRSEIISKIEETFVNTDLSKTRSNTRVNIYNDIIKSVIENKEIKINIDKDKLEFFKADLNTKINNLFNQEIELDNGTFRKYNLDEIKENLINSQELDNYGFDKKSKEFYINQSIKEFKSNLEKQEQKRKEDDLRILHDDIQEVHRQIKPGEKIVYNNLEFTFKEKVGDLPLFETDDGIKLTDTEGNLMTYSQVKDFINKGLIQKIQVQDDIIVTDSQGVNSPDLEQIARQTIKNEESKVVTKHPTESVLDKEILDEIAPEKIYENPHARIGSSSSIAFLGKDYKEQVVLSDNILDIDRKDLNTNITEAAKRFLESEDFTPGTVITAKINDDDSIKIYDPEVLDNSEITWGELKQRLKNKKVKTLTGIELSYDDLVPIDLYLGTEKLPGNLHTLAWVDKNSKNILETDFGPINIKEKELADIKNLRNEILKGNNQLIISDYLFGPLNLGVSKEIPSDIDVLVFKNGESIIGKSSQVNNVQDGLTYVDTKEGLVEINRKNLDDNETETVVKFIESLFIDTPLKSEFTNIGVDYKNIQSVDKFISKIVKTEKPVGIGFTNFIRNKANNFKEKRFFGIETTLDKNSDLGYSISIGITFDKGRFDILNISSKNGKPVISKLKQGGLQQINFSLDQVLSSLKGYLGNKEINHVNAKDIHILENEKLIKYDYDSYIRQRLISGIQFNKIGNKYTSYFQPHIQLEPKVVQKETIKSNDTYSKSDIPLDFSPDIELSDLGSYLKPYIVPNERIDNIGAIATAISGSIYEEFLTGKEKKNVLGVEFESPIKVNNKNFNILKEKYSKLHKNELELWYSQSEKEEVKKRLKNIIDNWDKIDNIISDNFSSQIKALEDITDDESESIRAQYDDDKYLTSSVFDESSNKLKLFFGFIPKNENVLGIQKDNLYKKYWNTNTVWTKISLALALRPNQYIEPRWEDYKRVILNSNLEFKQEFIDRVEKYLPPHIKNELVSTLFNSSRKLVTKIYNNEKNAETEDYDENGDKINGKTFTSVEVVGESNYKILKQEWYNNLLKSDNIKLVSEKTDNSTVDTYEITPKLKEKITKLEELISSKLSNAISKNREKYINELISILDSLGIILNNTAKKKLHTDWKGNIFSNSKGSLIHSLLQSLNKDKVEDLFSDNIIKRLIIFNNSYEENNLTNTGISGGKMIQAVGPIRTIEQRLSSFINKQIDLSNKWFSKKSFWIGKEDTIDFSHVPPIALKKQSNGKETKEIGYDEMTEAEHIIFRLANYEAPYKKGLRSSFVTAPMEDKKNPLIITAPRIILTESNKLNGIDYVDYLITQMVIPDLLRIKHETPDFENYNPKNYYLIPNLNNYNQLHDLNFFYEELMDQNNNVKSWFKEEQYNIIYNEIKSITDKAVEKETKLWNKYDIWRYLPDTLQDKNDYSRDHAIKEYVYNYINFHANEHIITGDPALYGKGEKQFEFSESNVLKALDNKQKRLSFINASHKRISEPRFIKVLSVNDPKFESLSKEYLKQFVLDDIGVDGENAFDKYSNIQGSDAQMLSTASNYFDSLFRFGKISEEIKDYLIKTVKKQSSDIKKYGKIQEGNFIDRKKLTDEDVILNPLKTVIGFQHDEVTRERLKYIKMSEFPLIPELTQGFEIDKLRILLEKNGDKLAFSTAFKVGSPFRLNLNVNDRNITLPEESVEAHTTIINELGYGIQTENPQKENYQEVHGSQRVKLQFLNLLKELFNYKDKSIKGSELKKERDRLYNRLFEIKSQKILNRLLKNGDINYEELSKILKDEIRDFDPTYEFSLKEDTIKNKIPLWLNPLYKRIVPKLMSIVQNNVSITKVHGKSYVQGFSDFFKTTDPKSTNIIFTDSFTGSLQSIREENGEIKAAQIIVPWKWKNLDINKFTKDGLLDLNKVPKEILEGIGYRIPTSGHNSITRFEIVGFIPEYMGNLILIPSDLMVQMGSDLDFDKLYSLFYNTHTIDYNKLYDTTTADILIRNIKDDISNLTDIPQDSELYNFLNEQSTEELKIQNELLDIDRSISLSKNEIHKRENHNPINYGKLLKLKSEKESEILNPLDPTYNIRKYLGGRDGKSGVGNFSLDNIFHASLQNTNISYVIYKSEEWMWKYFDGKETSKNKTINLDRTLTNASQKLWDKGERDYKKLRFISDIYSAYQQGMLDNGKEQLSAILNINNYTFNVIRGLVQTGHEEDEVDRILTHPKIIELIDKFREHSGIFAKYKSNTDILDEFIKNNPKEEVLKEFKAYDTLGRKMASIRTVFNIDSKGFEGSAWTPIIKKEQLYRLLDNKDFTNLDRLMSDDNVPTFQFSAFQKSLDTVNIFYNKNILPFKHQGVKNAINSVMNNIPEMFKGSTTKEAELRNKIFEEWTKYFFSGYKNILGVNDLKEERKRLLIKDPLSKKIDKIQKSDNNVATKNIFIKSLKTQRKNGLDFVMMDINQMDNISNLQMQTSIVELYDNKYPLLENYNSRDLVIDLYKYAYLVSQKQGANEFMKYLPLDYIFDKDINYNDLDSSSLITNLDEGVDSFMIQFFQHNPDLITPINTKHFAKENDSIVLIDSSIPYPTVVSNTVYDFATGITSEYIYVTLDGKTYNKINKLGSYLHSEYDNSINNIQTSLYSDIKKENLSKPIELNPKVITNIINQPNVPDYLKKFLNVIPKNVKIYLNQGLAERGSYNPETNSITVRDPWNDIMVLAHELIHANTRQLTDLYVKDPSKLTDRQRELIKNIDVIYKSILNDQSKQFKDTVELLRQLKLENNFPSKLTDDQRLPYAFINIQEFMAHFTDDKLFRTFLKDNYDNQSKPWYTKLRDLFKQLLNTIIGDKSVVDTIEEQIIELINTNVQIEEDDSFASLSIKDDPEFNRFLKNNFNPNNIDPNFDLPEPKNEQLIQKENKEDLYPEVTSIDESGKINYYYKAVKNITDNLNKVNQWYKQLDNTDQFWNKLQKDLQIPKDELELLKESEGNTIEEKITNFVANYSYTIEINTAKGGTINDFEDPFTGEMLPTSINEGNTSYYSNLTVSGGTNYTENEIAIPGQLVEERPQGVEKKEGVDFVFEQNPELANIGTPQQYSQYLDTIFPDSKVKDIVYHDGGHGKIKTEGFRKDLIGISDGGVLGNGFYFYFDRTKKYSETRSHTESVLLNVKNVSTKAEILKLANLENGLGQYEKALSKLSGITVDPKIKGTHGKYIGNYADALEKIGIDAVKGKYGTGEEIVVFEPEQIHILGSKQDIGGFKNWIKDNTKTVKKGAITPSIKGHATFSTDSGIGWFRSDEKQNYTEQDIDFLIDNMIKSGILQKNCS